jgi:hypothetical protein
MVGEEVEDDNPSPRRVIHSIINLCLNSFGLWVCWQMPVLNYFVVLIWMISYFLAFK